MPTTRNTKMRNVDVTKAIVAAPDRPAIIIINYRSITSSIVSIV